MVENIPGDLRALPQWVAWRKTDPDPETGKVGKQPINPWTGSLANHSKRMTWGPLEEALRRAQQDGLAGVGFVFTDEDDYVGIDLDRATEVVSLPVRRADDRNAILWPRARS